MTRAQATMDAHAIPAFLRVSLFAILIGAGLVSVFSIGRYGPVPTTVLLDAWFVLFLVHSIARRRLHAPLFFFGISAYLVVFRLLPAIAASAPLEDFLQAYRWVFYLMVLATAVGRRWGDTRGLIKVTKLLLIFALGKALLTLAILGPGNRPGLFLENNFELALFSGLLVVFYSQFGRDRLLWVGALGALTILSGSRSGSVLFLLTMVYVIISARGLNPFVRYVLFLMLPAAVAVAGLVFQSRSIAGRTIDRLDFFAVFRAETSDWNPLEWLLGTWPITPLSDGACSRLSFYENLFATTQDGSCYAVILHAFLMRVIFDAGIVGLVLAFASLWWLMRAGGVRRSLAATLVALALANSFSVSGPNNPYVVLPMLIAIVTAAGQTAPRLDRGRPERYRPLSRREPARTI